MLIYEYLFIADVRYRTALAEAELEYNEKHVSKAITVRFRVDRSSIADSVATADNCEIYALVWTTTPWTLLSNRAIAFNEQLRYCLVRIDDTPDLYVIMADSIPRLEASLQNSITIVQNIPSNCRSSFNAHLHTRIYRFVVRRRNAQVSQIQRPFR